MKIIINKFYKIKNKKAILHGRVGYYPVSKFSGIIVKDKMDLEIVSTILKVSRKNNLINHNIN